MSNAPSLPRLVVAAQGWRHADWQNRFYPDDLPEDWQLAYYANEFRAVLVPPPADVATCQEWLEAVDPGFGFCLDLRAAGATAGVLEALAGQTLAVLGEGIATPLPGSPAVFDPQRPVSLVLPASPAASVYDDTGGGGMRLCLYPAAPELDLPGLRADIEALLAGLPATASCIMAWCDQPPPLAVMQQAVVLAELLGA